MRSDIVPGGTFPDYELPDHTNVTRKLSEIQGDDPLILTLARGHYCPKEHQQHLELAAFYPKIAVAYTQVATIATDEHHTLQEFRASVGAQWPFLSDPGRIVQKDLDIQEYTDPEHDPMIPHTLVLKPGLVVHSIYNGYWFWGRPSVDDLWHDLRDVIAEIRPDWDLSTPGLREAWDAGDYSRLPRLGPAGPRMPSAVLAAPNCATAGRRRRRPAARACRSHPRRRPRRPACGSASAVCPSARRCTPARTRARRRRARRSPAGCRRRSRTAARRRRAGRRPRWTYWPPAARGRSRRLERRDDRVDVAGRERALVLRHDV